MLDALTNMVNQEVHGAPIFGEGSINPSNVSAYRALKIVKFLEFWGFNDRKDGGGMA
jgi:hypothetical protein